MTENPRVGGSIPPLATISFLLLRGHWHMLAFQATPTPQDPDSPAGIPDVLSGDPESIQITTAEPSRNMLNVRLVVSRAFISAFGDTAEEFPAVY